MRIDSAIITGSFSVNGDTFNDLGVFPSTGSNTFVGNQSIVGAVSASALTGSINYTNLTNVPTLVSGSEQIVSIISPLNSFTASNSTTNTFTSSATARLNALESTSASVDTLNTAQNTRLSNLEIKTGSLATTGSNTFIGTQTITGSLYISSDLIVQGTSSLQNITASAVSIGTNIINLNTANPAIRYAGLVIGDSGSIGSSGSFLYDSVQDEMIFVHRGANSTVTSSVTLMGPQTYDSIGNETYLTNNQLVKGAGNEHLADSNISDTGTLVTINSATSSFSGLVGIGTTLPGAQFEVTSTTGGTLRLKRNDTSVTTDETIGTVEFHTNDGDGPHVVSYIKGLGADFSEQNYGRYGALSFGVSKTALTDAVEAMRIDLSGNVGIGITNPSYPLDVVGDIHSTSELYLDNGYYLRFKRSSGGVSIQTLGIPIGTDDVRLLTTGDFNLVNGSLVNLMTVKNGGNVGIGYTAPTVRLQVSGSIAVGDNVNGWGRLSYDIASNTTRIQSSKDGIDAINLSFWTQLNGGAFGERMIISGSSVGIGNTNPKTRLQVTPQSNAEVPVLGTATGVAIFTSANTNYGLQFNSTSDGSFHMQSQRFDNSATSYALVLQPAGGTVAINGNSSQAALHIGEADTRKISYIGNHSIRRTNLFKTFNQGSTTDYWARISLNNSYADSTQGVYGTITVAWHPFHASMGRFYQYRFFQAPYTGNNSYMKIQTVFEETFGWDYYSFSSDVTFYNYQSYLYIKVTGTNANYAWARSIQTELTGGSYAMDNVNLEVGVSAPAGLSGIITKNGSAVLSG